MVKSADEVLRALETAVEHVGRLRAAQLDAFASEQEARARLFDRLAALLGPAVPSIAELRVPDEGGDFYYLVADERKGRRWYLGWRQIPDCPAVPTAPLAWWFASALLDAEMPAERPELAPSTEALRTIRLDEFVRRVAVRLRTVVPPMQARLDESARIARTLDAIAVLLGG